MAKNSSQDLGNRVLNACDAGKMPHKAIAQFFEVNNA